MEEDIKILEEQLKTYKRHIEKYEKKECLTNVYYELKKYAQALENLIKGYRELEEENKRLNKANKTYINCIQNITPVLMEDYIEKSKIKEKIEEYKKKIIEAREEDDDCKEIYYEQEIKILQELMEDK